MVVKAKISICLDTTFLLIAVIEHKLTMDATCLTDLFKIKKYIYREREGSAAWWRHQTFSALLALCPGNSPVTGEFPSQRQWRGALMFSLICAWINAWVGWWFAMPSCPLWRHCNGITVPHFNRKKSILLLFYFILQRVTREAVVISQVLLCKMS